MPQCIVVSSKQQYQLLKTSELLSLNPCVPEWQRYINQDRMQEIYNALSTSLSMGSQPILTGCLVLCKINKAYRLIDGHHRFEALKLIHNKLDVPVMCNIIECDTEEECKHFFKVTNHTLPLEVPDDIDLLVLSKGIVDELYQRFPLCFSAATNPRRPHLSKDCLSQKIAQVMPKVLWNKQQWIDKIIALNERYKKSPASTFVYPNDKLQTVEVALLSCKKKGNFFLGMFKYDWLETLVNEEHEIQKQGFKKAKIPLSVRVAVWNDQFGNDKRRGQCYVCREVILFENFDCSHIIAEKNGGKTVVSNLRCCCRKCNTSCGIDDLENLKRKFEEN